MANKHYDTLQINEQRCFELDIWNDTRHRLPICIGLEMQTDGGKSQFRDFSMLFVNSISSYSIVWHR